MTAPVTLNPVLTTVAPAVTTASATATTAQPLQSKVVANKAALTKDFVRVFIENSFVFQAVKYLGILVQF